EAGGDERAKSGERCGLHGCFLQRGEAYGSAGAQSQTPLAIGSTNDGRGMKPRMRRNADSGRAKNYAYGTFRMRVSRSLVVVTGWRTSPRTHTAACSALVRRMNVEPLKAPSKVRVRMIRRCADEASVQAPERRETTLSRSAQMCSVRADQGETCPCV